MKYVFYAILIYLAYQFVFNLVIPVYRTTRRIRKGFREMQERMQQQAYDTGQKTPDFTSKPASKADPNDYIEFEEVQ